jgi:hypothetical protein
MRLFWSNGRFQARWGRFCFEIRDNLTNGRKSFSSWERGNTRDGEKVKEEPGGYIPIAVEAPCRFEKGNFFVGNPMLSLSFEPQTGLQIYLDCLLDGSAIGFRDVNQNAIHIEDEDIHSKTKISNVKIPSPNECQSTNFKKIITSDSSTLKSENLSLTFSIKKPPLPEVGGDEGEGGPNSDQISFAHPHPCLPAGRLTLPHQEGGE